MVKVPSVIDGVGPVDSVVSFDQDVVTLVGDCGVGVWFLVCHNSYNLPYSEGLYTVFFIKVHFVCNCLIFILVTVSLKSLF